MENLGKTRIGLVLNILRIRLNNLKTVVKWSFIPRLNLRGYRNRYDTSITPNQVIYHQDNGIAMLLEGHTRAKSFPCE